MGISSSAYDKDRYKFPLPCQDNLPVPSGANYGPENVAWLIEYLGGIIGKSKEQITFRYENNTCTEENPDDDIFVSHPLDKDYLPEVTECKGKSDELKRYEEYAKRSARLEIFMKTSPANIEYFHDFCDEEN